MADETSTPTAESGDTTGVAEDGPTASRDDGRLTTADLVRGGDDQADDQEAHEAADNGSGEREPLFASDDAERFRGRWHAVQVGFVDEPRQAVQDADSLVAELMQQLAETFAQERSKLESQWDSGDDASTEDLRVAFQRYRSFFDRLLSA